MIKALSCLLSNFQVEIFKNNFNAKKSSSRPSYVTGHRSSSCSWCVILVTSRKRKFLIILNNSPFFIFEVKVTETGFSSDSEKISTEGPLTLKEDRMPARSSFSKFEYAKSASPRNCEATVVKELESVSCMRSIESQIRYSLLCL